MYLFKYETKYYRNKQIKHEQIIDEYLHGWCYLFQKILFEKLKKTEKYEIFEKLLKQMENIITIIR